MEKNNFSFLLPVVADAIETTLTEFPWYSKTKIRNNIAKLERAYQLLDRYTPEAMKNDPLVKGTRLLLQGVGACLQGIPLAKLGLHDAALTQFRYAKEMFDQIARIAKDTEPINWWVNLWKGYLSYHANHVEILQLIMKDAPLEVLQDRMSQLSLVLHQLITHLKNELPIHAYYVQGLAHELNGNLAIISAKLLLESNPLEARKLIYDGLKDFNRSRFLQVELSDKEINEYESLARTATINHWKTIIDHLWIEANNLLADGQYEKAAAKFYEGYTLLINLDELALHSDPIIELNLRIFQTSYHESIAELALQAEDHVTAAQEFQKAASILHLYISEMKTADTADLFLPFELQKTFYEAMYFSSLGIISLDEGDDILAKKVFAQALETFEVILPKCRELGLDPIINSIVRAKDKISTFLSLLEI